MPQLSSTDSQRIEVALYHWAGLDFLVDRNGAPVLIEANRSSHMLGEYLHYFGDDRPFQLTAEVMNRSAAPPCFLWRQSDPTPDADEDATFITRHLAPHLNQPPVICNVEQNQFERTVLTTRDGAEVQPGSIFRWWYQIPWNYERAGITVINPNAVWVVVRDKLVCCQTLTGAANFRVPTSFAVNCAADARRLLAERGELFQNGYILKPRVGWGGYDVQVAEQGDEPQEFPADYLLSERIHSRRADGRYFEVRMFVMAGVCLGGLIHACRSPNTNYWQGGEPSRLDDALLARLAPAALEAVARLDQAALAIHLLPNPSASRLTEVDYADRTTPTT